MQASHWILPTLLFCLSAHRSVLSLTEPQPFDYSRVHSKQQQDHTYDVFSDQDEFKSVVKELMAKGPVHPDFYMVLANFCGFWYFLSMFVTSTLAVSYYRKFREQ